MTVTVNYVVPELRKLKQGINSLRKQPSFFALGPSGVSREGRLRFTAENSILMTKICPASGHER